MDIEQFTENSITLVFSDVISEDVNRQVVHARQKIDDLNIEGVTELVLSYTSLIIYFNVLQITAKEVVELIQKLEFDKLDSGGFEHKVVEIPVCYVGEYVPEIDSFEED